MKRNIAVWLIVLSAMSWFIVACQKSPDDPILVNKGDLSVSIAQESSKEDQERMFPTDKIIKYEKQYESGNAIKVDANIITPSITRVPILSVQASPFCDGGSLENIVRVFFPHAEIREHNKLTKSDIEQQILYYKSLLFRAKNNLDLVTGEPTNSVDEGPGIEGGGTDGTLEDQLNTVIKQYEEEYRSAMADSDLPHTDYILKNTGDGSHQLNLKVISDGQAASVDFVNWPVGSELYIKYAGYVSNEVEIQKEFQLPTVVNASDKLKSETSVIEKYLRQLEIDYMELATVSTGTNYNIYYYTRCIDGYQETYADRYFGSQQLDAEGYPVMDLWKKEYVKAITHDGQLMYLKWSNPSQITNVDNENAKILPWESIVKIFKAQINLMITPQSTIAEAGLDDASSDQPTIIHINRVEFGATKLLMRNSRDYKLIPTWSFLGYDETELSNDIIPGGKICFVTINALDGSIIDRGQMY